MPVYRQLWNETVRRLKVLLTETTVHGCRYLVESRSVLDRLLWLLAIAVSLSYCIFFIATSISEAEENPISSYVEVVSGKEALAPAITVMPPKDLFNYYSRPFRLQTMVLNSFEFECWDLIKGWHDVSDDYDACMKTTNKLRDGFKQLLAGVVASTVDRFRTEMELHQWGHFDTPDNMLDPASTGQLTDIFCQMMQRAPDGFANESQIIEMLAGHLQYVDGSINDVTYNTLTEILLTYPGNKGLDLQPCTKIDVLNDPNYGPFLNTINMIDLGSDMDMSLGDIYDLSRRQDSLDFSSLKLVTSEVDSLVDEVFWKFPTEEVNMNELSFFLTGRGIKNRFNLIDWPPCALNNSCFMNWFKSDNRLRDMLRGFKYVYQAADYKIFKDSSYYNDLKFLRGMDTNGYQHGCNIEDGACAHPDPIVALCLFSYDKSTTESIHDIFFRDDCSAFHSTFGQYGMQYSYNQAPFWEMYKTSPYNEIFYHEVYVNNPLENDRAPQKSGDFMADFYIYPSADQFYNFEEKISYNLAIHDPYRLPAQRITLESGYLYKIWVTPSMVTTSKDLIALPGEKRQCRFMHEGPPNGDASPFKIYSQSTCYFECKLRLTAERVNCTPFDYPQLRAPFSICNHADILHYHNEYNLMGTNTCDCPSDCDMFNYELVVEKARIVSKGECVNPGGCHPILDFLANMENGPVNYVNEIPCIKHCSSLPTRVIVQMNPQSIVHTRRVRRTSFADQLATFGGLLGLFTGISVLSVMELLMWTKETLRLCLQRSKGEDGAGRGKNSREMRAKPASDEKTT